MLDLVGRRVAPVGLTKFHLTRGPRVAWLQRAKRGQ